ncbi:hypothetical protein [Holospora undulata]|nr:hypothetical protein [Holospora undulata]
MTKGQTHNLEGADHLVKAGAVFADKAYDADERGQCKLKEKGGARP